jgi:ferritin-like metal-binding protein YciE
MTPLDDQLVKYLRDAHSIEEQALQQLRMAPSIAGQDALAGVLEAHEAETERHAQAIRERLDAHGDGPSKVKDTVMRAGGVGFVLFARVQPDTPGKLAAHAFSYEHLEAAAYELLERVAEAAGDLETADVARDILAEERAMAHRLAGLWDETVDASLREVGADDLREQLRMYLADAHAIEAQAEQLLSRGPDLAGDEELARIYASHLEETRGHSQLVDERLDDLGGDPSSLKDLALRAGAINWAAFFQAHPDTPGKLAAFAYAFEHLEIGSYEQLRRVAERAGDPATTSTADRILAEERAAADTLAGAFDRAASASLAAVGAEAS